MKGSAVFGGPARPEESWDPQLGINRLNREAYQEDLEIAKGILMASWDELNEAGSVTDVYQGRDTPDEASELVKLLNAIDLKLRKLFREKPKDEKDVQDTFENLLIGIDVEYSREADSIEYSSKTYVPDFTMPKLNTAVEIKLCPTEKREKELIAEINDDILAYKQKYGNLIFVIYDLGHIRDTEKFKRHFEQEQGVLVKIIKH